MSEVPHKPMMSLQEIADDESGVARLVPGKSDIELAEGFRQEILPHLEEAAKIFTRAKAAGLIMSFSITPDSFGKNFKVNEITLVKPL